MSTANVAIIQARMGSSRFPGKMLALLDNAPLVEWVIRRLLRVESLDEVVLATSENETDDPLADCARDLGIPVFRGSETDVLGRLLAAAEKVQAKNVIRICADNPFIDPGEVERLIDYFKVNKCDYACNHRDRLGSGYADGFGAEILSTKLLKRIAKKATARAHREHVTLYLWDHAASFKLQAIDAPINLAFPELCFDVDLPKDLISLQALICAGVNIDSSASEIVRIAKSANPKPTSVFLDASLNQINDFLKRLFPLCRSITGEPNRKTLSILQEVIPLTIHEVPTGEDVYDWKIPDEWNIRNAWISDENGRRIVDFHCNNLHIVSYSEPVNKVMGWKQLQSHIHVHPDLPNAIPYRTSYYKRDWGFCVTQDQYNELAGHKGPFEIVIDSDLKPGAMSYGEYLIEGRSTKEILLSCYICHPSMANDSLSGVILTAFLARYIASLENRHWSYRVVFVPETIGAIAYCAHNEDTIKELDFGLVITTVGGPGKFGYKQSFEANHPINNMIEEVFSDAGIDFIKYPFDIHGSDERQYSSQGFRVNVATICRDRYYQYPFYHTSLDDLNFVSAKQITETLALYIDLIDKIENRRIYRNVIPNCEVMLSRHGLYPIVGGSQRPEYGSQSELDLTLWLLFLCDGTLSLEDISHRLSVEQSSLFTLAESMVAKGVLEVV